MDSDNRLRRMHYRAWHRGTREADYMIGGFFDRHRLDWDEAQLCWFEALLDEDDVDIMAWALKTQVPPAQYGGEMMLAMQQLDYIEIH